MSDSSKMIGRRSISSRKSVRLLGAALLLGIAVTIGLMGTAGAAITVSGTQVPGTALAISPFTVGTPFSSGQTIEVSIPANTVLNQNANVEVVECAAPNNVLPTLPSQCDPANTASQDTIIPNADGSFSITDYPIFALPDVNLSSSTITCGNTAATECVLGIFDNYNDFTQPHLFSQGFYINATSDDTGANPGDGSPPAAATVPSASLSTVVASQPTAVADGFDSSTVTVTLQGLNSQLATVPIPGVPVNLGQGSGHSIITSTPATTNSAGVATFTVTNTNTELVSYTATSGSVTVTEPTTVNFQAPVVSPTDPDIVASPATVAADGTTASTIIVTALDQAPQPEPIANVAVSLAASAGTSSVIHIVSATTDPSGRVTFTVTDNVVEPVTYTATVGGVVLATTVKVTFGTLAVSPTASTVVAGSATADIGVNQGTTVTVTLLSTNGNHPVPDKSVTLSQGTGTGAVIATSPTITDSSGVATFNVTDAAAEPVTFTATDVTDNNLVISQTAEVTFAVALPPTVSASKSSLSSPMTTMPADGTSAVNVFVTVVNTDNSPEVNGDVIHLLPVAASSTATVTPDAPTGSSTLGATDPVKGVAEFQVRDTTAESVALQAVDTHANVTITQQITATFTAGAVDATQSAVIAAPSAVAADGKTVSTVTVTLADHFENPVAGKTVSIAQGASHSVITPSTATTTTDGTATFNVTDAANEYVTYTATDVTDNNLVISQTAEVTFGSPPPVSADSAIVSNYSAVPADGTTAATISVLLFNTDGVPTAGRTVSLKASGGSSTISPASQVSDSSGTATFSVTDVTAESVTYTGMDTSDNVPVSGSVEISFTPVVVFAPDSPTTLNKPIVGMATTSDSGGYWLVAADGGVFRYGDANFFGSAGGTPLNNPVVGMAATADNRGYWLVASDGGIFAYGDANFYGSAGALRLNQPIVGMAATADDGGYWLVASDGGIFAYGDANFYGSTGGLRLNKPIVGMATTADGAGYWLVASDGGIFAYGDANFYGSTGAIHLNQPIVGMASPTGGSGYWLVASDGGIFAYGAANFYGSTSGLHLNRPIVGMAATADGVGYWLVASDGGIFNGGDANFYGSAS